ERPRDCRSVCYTQSVTAKPVHYDLGRGVRRNNTPTQGDNITAANVTVTTTGPNASALAMTAGGGGQPSTENFTDSTLASTLGPVIRVSGGGSNKFINLTRSSVIAAPGGQWLNATGGGNVTITASDATTLTGAAVTVSGIISSLTLLIPTTVW